VRRRLRPALLALPLAGWLARPAARPAPAPVPPGAPIEIQDRIDLPPPRREFSAPGGGFVLVVETRYGWASAYPVARLLQTGADPPRQLWQRLLVQQFGPRTALVSPQGRVLLVDEWINVSSRQALQLIDADNRVLATHGHDAVVAALGGDADAVARHARSGTWLGAAPVLSADGRTARIPAGGRTLLVSLADGRLRSE
jgi:hypothetical protein